MQADFQYEKYVNNIVPMQYTYDIIWLIPKNSRFLTARISYSIHVTVHWLLKDLIYFILF